MNLVLRLWRRLNNMHHCRVFPVMFQEHLFLFARLKLHRRRRTRTGRQAAAVQSFDQVVRRAGDFAVLFICHSSFALPVVITRFWLVNQLCCRRSARPLKLLCFKRTSLRRVYAAAPRPNFLVACDDASQWYAFTYFCLSFRRQTTMFDTGCSLNCRLPLLSSGNGCYW